MKLRTFVPALMLAATSLPAISAAQVEVTWQEPDSYTDVRPANESRKGFRERVFRGLDKHFARMAKVLPDDNTLAVTVTNLDLAGQVWPSSFVGFGHATGSDVRVIRRIGIPRIEFSYTLTDSTGAVVKSADVSLKDMGFMDTIASSRYNDQLRYEKHMLQEWFDEEMSAVVARK
ncbi:DUF3016 domain-containing protein [Alteromonas sp. ASW11-19]|uniref:DUF3016 domain-containing protein n=1 Tax=Alteromonas salexigens TaxID=2982530 RepID=A0ABT2VIS2_9ALTE|nr:DUF3016 domain-containing protein [Alteromonas salexigens]MCU7553060.1 DUF3016 domain-containing protein [Alteromonas salexigens]